MNQSSAATIKRSARRAQPLTFLLQGITAGDYLTWVRDPEPPALGRELRSIGVQADPLGDRIDVLLCWGGEPPTPRAAAATAGFALTPEVLELWATNRRSDQSSARRRRRPGRAEPVRVA